MRSIPEILASVGSIAVVGISAKPERAGFYVPEYMRQQSYQITGVSPILQEAQGAKAYSSLKSIPHPIDLVVLFRRSEDVPGHLDDILAVHPQVVWMQSGIRNEEVKRLLEAQGIEVVQDRCLMVEHRAWKKA